MDAVNLPNSSNMTMTNEQSLPTTIPIMAPPSHHQQQQQQQHRPIPKKPKRPLSAFNLFYRFKRRMVLDAIASGCGDKNDIIALVAAPPGLERRLDDSSASATEDADADADADSNSEEVQQRRSQNIRKDLQDNLLPRDTRDRAHRTNSSAMNGAMSFLELGKLMNTSWKSVDEFAKGVFNELAEEGRGHYRERMNDYNDATEGMVSVVGNNGSGKVEAPEVHATETKMKKDTIKKSTTKTKQSKSTAKKSKSTKKKTPKAPSTTASATTSASTSPVPSISTQSTASSSEGSATETRQEEYESKMARKRKHSGSPSAIHRSAAPVAEAQNMLHQHHHLPMHDTAALVHMAGDMRTVSADYSQEASSCYSSHQHSQPQPQVPQPQVQVSDPGSNSSSSSSSEQVALQARVKELEGQLATERLRARIRELEGELTRQKGVEGQLRAQLDVFTRRPHAPNMSAPLPSSLGALPPPPASGSGHHTSSMHHHHPPPPGDGGGLWSLVDASMIHPSVRSSERAAMLSRMVAARTHGHGHAHASAQQLPHPHHAHPHQHPASHLMAHPYGVPPPPHSAVPRREDEQESPVKKQRRK